MPIEIMNAANVWEIHDTVVISPVMYGPETSVNGWFTTFAAFAQRQDHEFFKGRSQANCGAPYNNQQSQDRTDFAFHCKSVGLRFFAPAVMYQYTEFEGTDITTNEFSHFWQADLPNHCGFSFQVEQDEKVLCNAMALPAGYGPTGGGATPGWDNYDADPGIDNTMAFGCSQGVPDKGNRFPFKEPIGIPRGATIKGTLWLSQYAQRILQNVVGPLSTYQGYAGGEGALIRVPFGARYGIQASLYGVREVQVRGQLHV